MIEFRRATRSDLKAIVRLLADDDLGATRERVSDDIAPEYLSAFDAIETDPNQLLAAMVDGEDVIGTLQLSFIPGLARGGALRGQIEAVRVDRNRRSEGLGERLFQWAIAQCCKRGCRLVQLTTDRQRDDAHRFYDRLGFVPSHIGYKLTLGE
jgi:GNAT superfamily N-acetyltransferase